MTRARDHLWYDVAWPALTGVGAAVGLIAAYRWTGPLVLVVALAVLWLTVAPLSWTVLTELGHPAGGVVVRFAPAAAVGILAVLGLARSTDGWGMLVALALLATSPAVRGWTRAGFTDRVSRQLSPRTQTRRAFDQIVMGLATPDDERPA